MLWLVALLGLSIGVVGLAVYQVLATNRDRRTFQPPGALIEIEGKRLHYRVMGEGHPIIVVDSGQGGTHLDWQLVQPEVAKFTRIVTYDRAGYGWSDSGTEPRTAKQIVKELRQLLKEAGIAPPYILVGMSLSGLFTRFFAYQYPEEVAGMVLVDVTHERINERMPIAMVKLNERFDWLAIHVLPMMARIGLFRLLVLFDRLPLASDLFKKLPIAIKSAAQSIYAQTQFWQTLGQESAAFSVSIQQVEQARSKKLFPEIPLMVLSSGKPDFGGTQELLQIMQELHADLANESPQGVQIIAQKSGHAIQLDDPELVIDIIRQVVEKARCSSTA
ncbi:alpha/beta hydrolase [Thermosynechococcaceae cyanobacterium BACA0444]|uniref:Alpha/beta hydrolase n=1 Tax=Pseudocalidococcus azoricus BACA0444 TaxID=2918990 RepID=A0AAE4FRG9_9CYAN|nr:alpha/beta hydrolase [Pseudocalidococcus azoricus]MDS3860958.1 alpha/beta hydrolase [Pseudocalidococcus azoricus BACA0444]